MTPNGFVNQGVQDNNEHQVHKSGWLVADMANLGFKCYGVSGLKFLRKDLSIPKIKPAFIGGMISNITEPFVYKNPEYAFHLICIKKTQ